MDPLLRYIYDGGLSCKISVAQIIASHSEQYTVKSVFKKRLPNSQFICSILSCFYYSVFYDFDSIKS